MGWTCGKHGAGRGIYRVLVGRPEGKRPLGRPRRRWEDNIKMDLREIGIEGENWIQLAQDSVQWRAFVNRVMNLRVPNISGRFCTFVSCWVGTARKQLLQAVSAVRKQISGLQYNDPTCVLLQDRQQHAVM
jgi:hypothetical protein